MFPPGISFILKHIPGKDGVLSTDILIISKKRLLFTAGLGAFMATMDTSLVSVGLPQIAAGLGTSVAAVSWVMVAYLLASASFQIIVGRLADVAAAGRLFAAGVILFAVASGLGGLSPGFQILIVCGLVQGVGGALMLGVAPKLIALSFAEGERGFALGIFSTGFATGVTLGAPLGGLLLTFLSWRALFFVNPVLGVILLITGSRVLGRFTKPRTWDWRNLDPFGGLVITATLAMFILTLTWVGNHGLMDGRNLLGLAAVAGGVVLAWRIERRQSNPLLHRDLWSSRGFILGTFGVLMAFACVMGVFFLLPFFLVQVFRFPPVMVGLMLAVLALSNASMAFMGGYLADRLGNVRILRVGLALICVGLCTLGMATAETSTLSLSASLALTGMGLGLFSAPNLNEILSGVPPKFMGLAASSNAVLKNLGALIGVIVLVAALGWDSKTPVTLNSSACFDAPCFDRAFWLAGILAILNFLVNLIPRKTA